MTAAALLEVIRPGRHRAVSGHAITLSESDLRASAAAYDPALHEAPLVVGHPKINAPAYGWVSKLSFDRTLEAEPAQVDPAFAEMLRLGRFKKHSAAFYDPNDPNNPAPGVYYLRHIGFLGAHPPAVKGLRQAEFAGADDRVLEFVEGVPDRWYFNSVATLFRRLRDHLIDSLGLEKADEVMPEWQVSEMEQAAAKVPQPAPSFSEPEPEHAEDEMSAEDKARLAALEAENAQLKAREAEFAEREQQLARQEATQRKAEVVEFVEGLVADGKVLPKDRDAIVELIVAQPAGVEIEFAEGDSRVKRAAQDALRQYLQGLPKIVEFGERGARRPGAEIDTANPHAVANRAREYQDAESQAGRRVSTAAAVQHVIRGA